MKQTHSLSGIIWLVTNTIIWIDDNCLISNDCKLLKGISKRNNYDSSMNII